MTVQVVMVTESVKRVNELTECLGIFLCRIFYIQFSHYNSFELILRIKYGTKERQRDRGIINVLKYKHNFVYTLCMLTDV